MVRSSSVSVLIGNVSQNEAGWNFLSEVHSQPSHCPQFIHERLTAAPHAFREPGPKSFLISSRDRARLLFARWKFPERRRRYDDHQHRVVYFQDISLMNEGILYILGKSVLSEFCGEMLLSTCSSKYYFDSLEKSIKETPVLIVSQ